MATIAGIARKHGLRPVHVAQTMGISRQAVDQMGKTFVPTAKTLIKVAKAFTALGVPMTAQKLFEELMDEPDEVVEKLKEVNQ